MTVHCKGFIVSRSNINDILVSCIKVKLASPQWKELELSGKKKKKKKKLPLEVVADDTPTLVTQGAAAETAADQPSVISQEGGEMVIGAPVTVEQPGAREEIPGRLTCFYLSGLRPALCQGIEPIGNKNLS